MDPSLQDRIARLLPAMLNPRPAAGGRIWTPPPPTRGSAHRENAQGLATTAPPPLVWETRGDPVLGAMARAAGDFERAVRSRSAPRWLTLWGSPGTGKTFLARQLYAMHPGRARWMDWVRICRRYQRREDIGMRLRHAEEALILIVDDIGAEYITEGTLSLLHGLLHEREGRWTVLTSNLSPNQWRERDARIASRMIRGENRHVDCRTEDFAMR